MLAGHESTGSTTTWALYELARHPDFQDKVRDEIRATRDQATQRGDGELSVADLDSMKCLLALMKVRPLSITCTWRRRAVDTYTQFNTLCAGDAQILSYSIRPEP
jgi:cytochrome P450